MDNKETDKNTKFVKEEHESKTSYIFQKNTITKIAFVIVLIFLVIVIIGLIVSGTSFFDSSL